MQVEPLRLLGGETGRDFVVYDEYGEERFSARLMDGSNEVVVAWTDNLPLTVLRLRQLQELAGGANRIGVVKGTASSQLEEAVATGTFDEDLAAELLGRSLGGRWQVQV